MKVKNFRVLVGEEKFDESVSTPLTKKGTEKQQAMSTDAMKQEPNNHGMKLREIRRANKRASERRYTLPHLDALLDK